MSWRPQRSALGWDASCTPPPSPERGTTTGWIPGIPGPIWPPHCALSRRLGSPHSGTAPISHARSGTDNVRSAGSSWGPQLSHGLPQRSGHGDAANVGGGGTTTALPTAAAGQDAVGMRPDGHTRAGPDPGLRHPLLSQQGGVWYAPAWPHSPNWSRLFHRQRRSAGSAAGPAPMLSAHNHAAPQAQGASRSSTHRPHSPPSQLPPSSQPRALPLTPQSCMRGWDGCIPAVWFPHTAPCPARCPGHGEPARRLRQVGAVWQRRCGRAGAAVALGTSWRSQTAGLGPQGSRSGAKAQPQGSRRPTGMGHCDGTQAAHRPMAQHQRLQVEPNTPSPKRADGQKALGHPTAVQCYRGTKCWDPLVAEGTQIAGGGDGPQASDPQPDTAQHRHGQDSISMGPEQPCH